MVNYKIGLHNYVIEQTCFIGDKGSKEAKDVYLLDTVHILYTLAVKVLTVGHPVGCLDMGNVTMFSDV